MRFNEHLAGRGTRLAPEAAPPPAAKPGGQP
jgi:hypothetical protein